MAMGQGMRMKKHYRRFAPLLIPITVSVLLVSCVDPGYSGAGHDPSSGGGHGVYSRLPEGFVGDSYFYNGHYYSGGRYQTGRYNDRGRSYSNRYFHNGRYYYGGDFQQHAARGQRRDQEHQGERNSNGARRPSESHSRSSSINPASDPRH